MTRHVLELDTQVPLRRMVPPVRIGDVLEHCLSAIAEARRLYGRNLEATTQLVDDESGERLALDVLRNDQQRLAGLHHRLQKRKQFIERRQFLFIDQEIGVFHLDPHLVRIGDEVGRDVAAVELHAFHHLELGLERFRLLDGDDALIADFLHGVGDEPADLGIAVGRNRSDLGDLVVRGDILGVLLQVLDNRSDGEVDATFEIHRVHPGRDPLAPSLTIAWARIVAVVVPSPA